MSISVKNITVSIDGTSSSMFTIQLEGKSWYMDHFSLYQRLLTYNTLTFSMHTDPLEDQGEPRFTICSYLIGKEITLTLQTDYIEKASNLQSSDEKTADIEFKGVIIDTSGNRSNGSYTITVGARSWDALLEDNPTCKSFENKTLNEIVQDVVDDYSDNLQTTINARFTDEIPYCVQYNETNYQFLQRLARRYGEWFYCDGTQLVFGNMVEKDPVQLTYPGNDVSSYNVDLKMKHTAFSHLASSYNASEANQKDGLSEMQKPYNDLADQTFLMSQERFKKQTLQNLHAGGFADIDGRETILDVSTKAQARAEKAGMLKYSGVTYSSKISIGAKLLIKDNYIVNYEANAKSQVDQDEILITDLVHSFSDDKVYSNHFVGIPASCDYPPYSNGDIYPESSSCRAKVKDNEDPSNLGRIRVQFDWQAELDEDMMTPWIRIAQPYAGAGKGFSFIPEIGEEVMVDFEGGNAEKPYVKGMLFNGIDDPDSAWLADGNSENRIKAIRTRNGHTIEIHDDNEGGYIRIYDKDKENYVLTLSTDEQLIKLESKGNIELRAAKNIIMRAGHNIRVKAGSNIKTEAGKDIDTRAENDVLCESGKETRVTSNEMMVFRSENGYLLSVEKDLQMGAENYLSVVRSNQVNHVEGDHMIKVAGKEQQIADNIKIKANNAYEVQSMTNNQKATTSMALDSNGEMNVKGAICKVN
jgi:Rhs element Vgr protein